MTQYRQKKRISVNAIQWTGRNKEDVAAFLGENTLGRQWSWEFEFTEMPDPKYHAVYIINGKNEKAVYPNDWIIKYTEDEIYTCSPELFDLIYEAVSCVCWEFRPVCISCEADLSLTLYCRECESSRHINRCVDCNGLVDDS